MEFERKLDNFKRKFHKVPPRNIIKNEEQLAGMRESSKINIAVLDYVAENIHAGMTTQDQKVGREIVVGAHSPSYGFENKPEE